MAEFDLEHSIEEKADRVIVTTTKDVFNKALEGYGVDLKEVAKLSVAENKIMEKTFPFAAGLVAKHKKNVEVKFGSGNGSMVLGVKGKRMVPAGMPEKGKPQEKKEKYGTMTCTKVYKVPACFRKGSFASEIESTVRKGWEK